MLVISIPEAGPAQLSREGDRWTLRRVDDHWLTGIRDRELDTKLRTTGAGEHDRSSRRLCLCNPHPLARLGGAEAEKGGEQNTC